MLLTPAQQDFISDVEKTVLQLGGMKTKFTAYPLCIKTRVGVLRVKPVFDGIECMFVDAPAAKRNCFNCRIDGTTNFRLPLAPTTNDFESCLLNFSETVKSWQ